MKYSLIAGSIALFATTSAYAQSSSIVTWADSSFSEAIRFAHPNVSSQAIFKDTGNLIWYKEPKKIRLVISEAREHCENLEWGGLTNFRLPFIEEILALEQYPKLPISVGLYWTGTQAPKRSNGVLQQLAVNTKKANYKNNEFSYNGFRKYDYREVAGKDYGFRIDEHRITDNYTSNIICVSDEYVGDDVGLLTEKLIEKKRQLSAVVMQLDQPEPPSDVSVNLIKGEFETTAAFQDRVGLAKTKYIQDMEQFDLQVLESERREIADRLKAKQRVEEFNRAASFDRTPFVQAAVNIVYGSPIIESAQYDADAGTFNVSLNSSTEKYNEKVTVPVDITYAPQFKSILLADGFQPTVNFKYDGFQLVFESIEELLSPEAIVEKNELQRAQGSEVLLKEFVNKYPQSPLASRAKTNLLNLYLAAERLALERASGSPQRLRAFLANHPAPRTTTVSEVNSRISVLEETARLRAEKKASDNKIRAEEEARQDEYDRKYPCERYYVGYVGEYERGGWLATGEKFVIRYTNEERKSVTIEATESGNSLSYGENKELGCYDLIQAEKRARN